MTLAKPFIKWVGGKSQLLNTIWQKLPKDFSQREWVYVEPFVGGGAVLFCILQMYPKIKKAVINDINPDLTTAYKTIKEKPLELIDALSEIASEYLPLDYDKRKEYYLQKRDLFNTKALDDIYNTAIFIFLNRTCFNGLYRVNQKGGFNVPFGRYPNPIICDKSTILADSKLLQKVEILTGDFENTLQFANENAFYYCDPPYKPISATSSFNSYTIEPFDDKEQIRLARFCDKISELGASFILSNSDLKNTDKNNTFFDNLYCHYQLHRVSAIRAINVDASKRGKISELIIKNY